MENINISQQYDDPQHADDDVHYATFSGLAAFFGRDMRPHWHDRFFSCTTLTAEKWSCSWMSIITRCRRRYLC